MMKKELAKKASSRMLKKVSSRLMEKESNIFKKDVKNVKSSPEVISQRDPSQPHILPLDNIHLHSDNTDQLLSSEKDLIVPPTSPRNFICSRTLATLPSKLKDVNNLDIPYVRVHGIKRCIELLGDHFKCTQYSTNSLQFWFLDFVTDCLWRCQDEYLLNEKQQKNVLEWVLYFFDIIRDPMMNLSRGQFFRTFREVVSIAEDQIESGQEHFPSPDDLFRFKKTVEKPIDLDSLEYDESTDSSLSSGNESDESFLVMPSEDHPDTPEFHKLPQRPCKCDILSITSSTETLSEKSLYLGDDEDRKSLTGERKSIIAEPNILTPVTQDQSNYSISDFYKPDLELHSRFLDDTELNADEISEQTISKEEVNSVDNYEYTWVNVDKKKPKRPNETSTSSKTSISIISDFKKTPIKAGKRNSRVSRVSRVSRTESAFIKSEQVEKNAVSEEELLNAWFEYNIWEQRRKDMDDPEKGWVPLDQKECNKDCICEKLEYTQDDFESVEYIKIKREWMDYLSKRKTSIDRLERNKFVNNCLLLIIKQIIFEYFYETFQYKLVKMAFQSPPCLILESLLTDSYWPTPKLYKDDLKRPVEKLPKRSESQEKLKHHKKHKKSKDEGDGEKKEKKSRSRTKSKNKSKSRSRSRSKSKSSSDEEKKKKGKKTRSKSKSKKSDKSDKPPKLSKAEQAALKKKEEEERLKQKIDEENRKFIFPLRAAVNEGFFKKIFKNYGHQRISVEQQTSTTKKKKKKRHH